MIGEYFFYIPIYRRTPEDHEKHCLKVAQRNFERFKKFGGPDCRRAQDEYQRIQDGVYEPQGLTDILGWLLLNKDDSNNTLTLRCELRWDKHPRRLNRNYDFYDDSAIRIPISNDLTSDDIYNLLLLEIRDFTEQEDYIKGYIDISQLELIGPYMDWRKIIDNLEG